MALVLRFWGFLALGTFGLEFWSWGLKTLIRRLATKGF